MYYNVTFSADNTSFRIDHAPHKCDSAIVTLAKIETALKTNLKFESDTYKKYDLKEISFKIYTAYNEKVSRINCLLQIFYSEKKKAFILQTSIENYLSPPPLFPCVPFVPDDIVNSILKYLTPHEQAQFAQVNRKAHKLATKHLLNYAKKEYDFAGSDYSQVQKHINKCLISYALEARKAGDTPILHSIRNNDLNFTRLMLSKQRLNSLLFLAAQHGTLDAVKLLISRGAEVTVDLRYNVTPLNPAVYSNDLRKTSYLIEKGAPIDLQDCVGKTPLYIAIHMDNPKMVKLLLDKGADIFVRDRFNMTPYAVACGLGNREIIRMISSKSKSE